MAINVASIVSVVPFYMAKLNDSFGRSKQLSPFSSLLVSSPNRHVAQTSTISFFFIFA